MFLSILVCALSYDAYDDVFYVIIIHTISIRRHKYPKSGESENSQAGGPLPFLYFRTLPERTRPPDS